MKIAVYAVASNQAHLANSFMDCCRQADVIVIADACSTDATAEFLRQQGALVSQIAVQPWRFDAARMSALNLVPADVDVCIKLNLDERLAAGWRQALEMAWRPGTTRLRYWYTANGKTPGRPDLPFRGDLIHARSGYLWRHPANETLCAIGSETIAESELAIVQLDGPPQLDNLSLLELAVREQRCPHTLFSLGLGHVMHRQWQEGLQRLQEYLALPEALGRAERSHAMRMLGACCQQQGKGAEAVTWLLRSCAEDAGLRENWLDLAQLSYDQLDWLTCYYACEKALTIQKRPSHYPSFKVAWEERPHDLASVAAWYLGWRAKAAEHLWQALMFNPDDERLQSNARFILPELILQGQETKAHSPPPSTTVVNPETTVPHQAAEAGSKLPSEARQEITDQQDAWQLEGEQSIQKLGHRAYVGGMWEEIGQLQFDFLLEQGLKPAHCFLDIACGSLRAGFHLIHYLQVGNYLGIDKERKLIELGIEHELGKALYEAKRPELIVSDCFDFNRFSKKPQFALAQSLFTHLHPSDIRLCFANLRQFVEPGHLFFATFFEGSSASNPQASHSHATFRYAKDEMVTLGERAGWKATFLGQWNHPRNQLMMKYEVVS